MDTTARSRYGAVAPTRPTPEKTLIIWAWCPICWVTTYQVFEREDARFEHYRCDTCGQIHSIAVR